MKEKDFSLYSDMLKNYQEIDLTNEDKKILEAFDNDIAEKLRNEVLSSLIKKMLSEELSPDFIRWAKFALFKFSKHFKK